MENLHGKMVKAMVVSDCTVTHYEGIYLDVTKDICTIGGDIVYKKTITRIES